jgi:hypothetical protein
MHRAIGRLAFVAVIDVQVRKVALAGHFVVANTRWVITAVIAVAAVVVAAVLHRERMRGARISPHTPRAPPAQDRRPPAVRSMCTRAARG